MNSLEVRHVKKVYESHFASGRVEALQDITFDMAKGEFCAVMGESGSGKTTLLNILAALDTPSQGSVKIDGQDLLAKKGSQLARFRRAQLGYIFQDYNLLDPFSNRDNILLPMVLNQDSKADMERKLEPLAKKLGIADLLDRYPFEISGGQKQRVVIARALITSPALLLADEPTGALDSKAAQSFMELLETLNRQDRQTILMVTHSLKAASFASRVLFIKDGRIFHQILRGEKSRQAFFEEISAAMTLLAGSMEAGA